MKELTRAEMQIMQIIWKIKKGFLKEILEQFPSPRPAPTTVSTLLRILTRKEFLGFHVFGKSHQYYPLVTKKEYARESLSGFMDQFFDQSPKRLFSFFTQENELTVQELEEMRNLLEKEIEEKRG